MRKDAEKRLLELGFDTDLIIKIDLKSLTLASLKSLSKEALLSAEFTNEESDLIISKVRRAPIQREVLDAILLKSGEVCCYCADGNSTRPFHIHHIDEYHISQNNAEDNLALVCPNDHASIHSKKIPVQEQKTIKEAWENLWGIAQQYNAKGFSFPFGAFEIVDYNIQGSIIEIFEFSSPRGSVCKKLANGSISQRCIEILNRENVLVLVGGSGSGKTTLAKGIAGSYANTIVYKYVTSDKSSTENAKEIAQFMQLAQKKLVLIIDDANLKLKAEQLETIVKLGNSNQRIIIVNTRDTFSDEGNKEHHFFKCTEYLDWSSLRDEVVENLLKHEVEIIEYLNDNDINDFNGTSIGYSVFEHRLDSILPKYARSTDTVWQFIFLLAGGVSQTGRILRELQAIDRFDVLVIYTSIKQIAKVEDGVSLDELLELYKRNINLNGQSEPDKSWLKEKLNELCSRRILKEVRGKYKTVHREFAKSLIETAYLFNRITCSDLLDEIFKDLSRSKEIIILWSWLKQGQANDYTKRWSRSLTIEQWRVLAEGCVKDGLGIFSTLARHLHTTTLPNHSQIANEVFKDKAEIIARLVNEGSEGTLFYFGELSTTLNYHCPEVIKPILQSIQVTTFAQLIKDSDIEIFENLSWLFHHISNADMDWIVGFRSNFKFSDFHQILNQKATGHIFLICNLVQFYRNYLGDLKRSEYKYIIELIVRKLNGAHLKDIRFPELYQMSLQELMYYPDDIIQILDAVNLPEMIKDFEEATPRYWDDLLSLCMLAEFTNSTFGQDFVDNLNIDRTVANIEKHYQANPHEFRIVIYQLAYGSRIKKHEFALRLQPLIEKFMEGFPEKQDYEDILTAFHRLDHELCSETCVKLKKKEPTGKERPSFDFQEARLEIERLESTGEDYTMLSMLVTKKDESTDEIKD